MESFPQSQRDVLNPIVHDIQEQKHMSLKDLTIDAETAKRWVAIMKEATLYVMSELYDEDDEKFLKWFDAWDSKDMYLMEPDSPDVAVARGIAGVSLDFISGKRKFLIADGTMSIPLLGERNHIDETIEQTVTPIVDNLQRRADRLLKILDQAPEIIDGAVKRGDMK